MATPIDKKLPHGNSLKTLLVQNQLTETYIQKTLQKKGIFFGQKSKEKTIPILCACLLTPNEFSEIKDHRSEKEDSTKQRSEKLKGKTKTNLNALLPDELDVLSLGQSEYDDYNFIGIPSFDMVENNPNHLKLDYEIKCNNYIDSWTEQGKKYHASIELKKIGDSIDTIATTSHTGTPTEKINRKILNHIKQHLRKNGDIEDLDSRILFSLFNNEKRIKFFWSMTANSPKEKLKFDRITDVSLKADDVVIPPKDLNIDWLVQDISKVQISGESLQNTIFISDDKYYPYLIVWRMQAAFRYEINNTEGTCRVNFEFENHYRKKENSEFEIAVDSITPDRPYKHVPTRSIRAAILEELSQMKLDNIEQYMPD